MKGEKFYMRGEQRWKYLCVCTKLSVIEWRRLDYASYTVKVVDACTSGKVHDEPRSVVTFAFARD